MDHVVVVGASLAGARAAEAVRRTGFSGDITVIGAESHMPYQRPPLSKDYLAGTAGRERLEVRLDPAAVTSIEWRLGWQATGLDLGTRRLTIAPTGAPTGAELDIAGGEDVAFDALVIATGCAPRWLGPDRRPTGLFVLRTVDDADALRAELQREPKVVVVGAGFIGSEVASTCRSLDLDVTILEALPVPLARAVGEQAGSMLGELHAAHGVRLVTGAAIDEIVMSPGEGRVAGVRLASGDTIDADVVVVGIGVTPATSWLNGSGVALENGVACDEHGFVYPAGDRGEPLDFVVAAGDVAQWRRSLFDTDLRVEHWSDATELGALAGANLVRGRADAQPLESVPYFWSDQYGQKIAFVGTTRPGDTVHVLEDERPARLLVGYERDGVVVGILGLNAQAKVMQWRNRIAARQPI